MLQPSFWSRNQGLGDVWRHNHLKSWISSRRGDTEKTVSYSENSTSNMLHTLFSLVLMIHSVLAQSDVMSPVDYTFCSGDSANPSSSGTAHSFHPHTTNMFQMNPFIETIPLCLLSLLYFVVHAEKDAWLLSFFRKQRAEKKNALCCFFSFFFCVGATWFCHVSTTATFLWHSCVGRRVSLRTIAGDDPEANKAVVWRWLWIAKWLRVIKSDHEGPESLSQCHSHHRLFHFPFLLHSLGRVKGTVQHLGNSEDWWRLRSDLFVFVCVLTFINFGTFTY